MTEFLELKWNVRHRRSTNKEVLSRNLEENRAIHHSSQFVINWKSSVNLKTFDGASFIASVNTST